MAMTINTNIQSLNAQRNLGTSQSSLSTSMQRLSSGLRINSAKDDAAGMAIASRMQTQITGLNQAQRNANDGVSLAQTAEGALSTIGGNLQRIRELAVQSRNATNSDDDRAALQKEVSQLTSEIDRVAKNTSFNGTNLLDGSFTAKAFQVGANQGQLISIDNIVNAQTSELGQWTSVATEAKVAGSSLKADLSPAANTAGKINVPGAAVKQDGANASFGWDSFTVKIGSGTQVTIDAVNEVGSSYATAADAQKALSLAVAAKLQGTAGALPEDVTVLANAAGDGVSFSSMNAKAQTVTLGGANAAVTKTDLGAATPAFSGLTGDNLKINGVQISVDPSMSTSASARQDQLVKAINDATLQTGVKATLSGGQINLASDVGNIKIETDAAAKLQANGFSVVDTSTDTKNAFKAGEGKVGFADVDISTVAGADNAIKAMDAALKSVNSARADLGAIQNRFESVVSNLSVNSENLSASKSRIMDADFASETANLSRSQILQQAGTAMVAQANQLPQGVLSLLR